MNMNTKIISILVGGNSTEYDASIKSYLNIINSVGNRIAVKNVIHICQDKVFVYSQDFPKEEADFFINTKEYQLTELPQILSDEKCFIFNLLHGNDGEDGGFQGLAQIYNLSGSFGKIISASLTMNKWQMSEMVSKLFEEINLIPYLLISKNSTNQQLEKFIQSNPSDFFILKPNKLGASLFTYKISADDVVQFIRKNINIFDYDDTFLLQKYILGREITVGVIQNSKDLNTSRCIGCIEAITRENFLGHNEKHKKGLVTPNFKIEDQLFEKLARLSTLIFNNLKIDFFCRFDYIVQNNDVFFLEANFIPGIMKQSAFTKMLHDSGITIEDLILNFIEIDSNNTFNKVSKSYRYTIE